MSYVAPAPDNCLSTVVGDGQCVAYVKTSAGCPVTSKWAEGIKVRGGNVAKHTAIAVFQSGQYNNHTDGRSHAAILIEETKDGLRVYDQWKGQPVHERIIRFKGGQGKPVNDGDAFSVIEDIVVLAQLARRRFGSLNGVAAKESEQPKPKKPRSSQRRGQRKRTVK